MLHESICILWWIQNTKNSWGVGPGMLNVCILLSIGSYGWELNWWKEWSERVTLYSENVIMQFSKIDGENNYLFPLLHLCILSCWMEQLFLDSKWCTDLASNESSHAIETNSSQRLLAFTSEVRFPIWGMCKFKSGNPTTFFVLLDGLHVREWGHGQLEDWSWQQEQLKFKVLHICVCN